MLDEAPATSLVIRLAMPEDVAVIEMLDSFSVSPTRHIHREMEKYFGSIDPSTHEKILIFLAEVDGSPAAKAELMLPPVEAAAATGYIKRVVVHPDFRKQGLAQQLMQHIIAFASTIQGIIALDLHVWENNLAAIRLYESLGFDLQHRELYYRLPL
ncbi:MAG: ribosomal protein S18-alanine N-acetyltransferase [Ktedonobacteraceae bacterium]